MLRRLCALLVLAAVLSACGGDGERAKPPPDPVETLRALVAAVVAGDAKALPPLLTRASRGRVTMRALERRLRPFKAAYAVQVAEPAGPTWAVVAITNEGKGAAGSPAAFAATLRREQGRWRHELDGPVRIEPIGPDPGSRERLVVQVAARIAAHVPISAAALWVDGAAVEARGGASPDGRRYTAFANLPAKLPPGRHFVVAFASAGRSASALAWAFTVPR
ncbi:MAG: hypothetical protein ABR521_04955 [Gaiellaceae bacterium]